MSADGNRISGLECSGETIAASQCVRAVQDRNGGQSLPARASLKGLPGTSADPEIADAISATAQ